jgi:hypothetical protein
MGWKKKILIFLDKTLGLCTQNGFLAFKKSSTFSINNPFENIHKLSNLLIFNNLSFFFKYVNLVKKLFDYDC